MNRSVLAAVAGCLTVVILGLGAGALLGHSSPAKTAQRGLFLVSYFVEIAVLVRSFQLLRQFERGEPKYTQWLFITLFIAFRVLAQTRTCLLYFDLVQPWLTEPSVAFVYLHLLRLLYTVSDLFLVVALVQTIRTYRATGLPFRVGAREIPVFVLVSLIPIVGVFFLDGLSVRPFNSADAGADRWLMTYRAGAMVISTFVVFMCLVIRRFAQQMGGGAVAAVWLAVAVAGLLRAGAYVVYSALSVSYAYPADLLKQILFFGFAAGWLIATLRESALIRGP
ncbi:MAG: hypothetical protein AAFU77_14770 [Myxococcota bacterium]